MPSARFWTLYAADRSRRVIASAKPRAAALHSYELLRMADNSCRSSPSDRGPTPGNWLALSGRRRDVVRADPLRHADRRSTGVADVELPQDPEGRLRCLGSPTRSWSALVGAGIVHIAVLFLLPQFSDRDAWSRLAMAADLYRRRRGSTPTAGEPPVVKSIDPLFYAAACRFDLGEGIVHVRAPGKVPFWSVSVYDRGGQNIYSFNDRTAEGGVLDFVVLTPAQMIEVRKQLPEEFERSIFVETSVDEGIVVIRSFVPDQSWRQTVTSFLRDVSCELE